MLNTLAQENLTLEISIDPVNKLIRIDFGEKLTLAGLTPASATFIAQSLLKAVEALKRA